VDKLSLAQAMQAPRVHHQYKPDDIFVEETIPSEMVAALEKRGYPVVIFPRLAIGTAIHLGSERKLQAILDARF
jgi:gamma-glutamyltranspeptidase/glutathione hydrolase